MIHPFKGRLVCITPILALVLLLQVGVKGNPKGVNKGLDCDVIVAEVGTVISLYFYIL